MREQKTGLLMVAVALIAFCAGADVVTNILRVEEMTSMLQGMVLQNNNDALYANNADYPTGNAGALMMGYAGANKRGLVYTTIQDVLGVSSIQAGTYTMTMQVGINKLTAPWGGMWDTTTASYNRTDPGFAGVLFTTLDGASRVAYTIDSANAFNLMEGVSVSVVSDPSLNVLVANASLTEDIWYDVTYTWTINEAAAAALDGQTVYVGMAGATVATTPGSILWIANSEFTFESIPEPATLGMLGVAAIFLSLIRRLNV